MTDFAIAAAHVESELLDLARHAADNPDQALAVLPSLQVARDAIAAAAQKAADDEDPAS